MKEIKFRVFVENKFYYFSLNDWLAETQAYAGSLVAKITRAEKQLYIGLKDKNGKEIYEGNKIISDTVYLFEDSDITKTPATVIWIDKLACFGLELGGRKIRLFETLEGWDSSVFEVIGNIYENKLKADL